MTASLRVNDAAFDGFESGSVQLTLDEAVNSFELTYVAPDGSLDTRVVFEGDDCELLLGDEVVIRGYVDETDEQDEPDALTLRAVGRSRTGDLVDCSAIQAPGRWSGATLDRIVTELCLPFGVSSYVATPGEPFEAFSVQKGESVYDTIARAAAKRGLLVYSVGGDLVLARAGQYRTATVLERGLNVSRSQRASSLVNRYSQYVFAGQGRPDERTWGKASQQLAHTVTDPGVPRYRPLRVTAEAHSGLDLQARATLERNQRAGRAERVSCVVEGHTTVEGYAWRPNTLVHFRNPILGVDATLLVVTARFRFGAAVDDVTELELARPEAYDLGKYPALGRGMQWT